MEERVAVNQLVHSEAGTSDLCTCVYWCERRAQQNEKHSTNSHESYAVSGFHSNIAGRARADLPVVHNVIVIRLRILIYPWLYI